MSIGKTEKEDTFMYVIYLYIWYKNISFTFGHLKMKKQVILRFKLNEDLFKTNEIRIT